MKYWELLKEENEAVAERHELAMERIGHMKEEATVGEPYRAFFERTVQFIELIEETFQKQMDGTLATMSQEEAAEFGAFIADQGAEQCGFCNPGFIMNALALFREIEYPNEDEIKEYLAGNLCRCSGYEGQLRGIQAFLEWKKEKNGKEAAEA